MVYDTVPGNTEWVQPLDSQRVRKGSTVIQPIKSYALAEGSTDAIYTSSGRYKVIDIVGNLDFNNTNPKRDSTHGIGKLKLN